MPKELERKLKMEATKKFKSIKSPQRREAKIDAYVYGTLRKMGWRPQRERKKKG